MALSVASITISYNGKSLLARHINSLLAQKRPIDEIVVVDNGSVDGTIDNFGIRVCTMASANLASPISTS